jgi:hypothetical protein
VRCGFYYWATREDDKLFFIFCLVTLLSFADGLCKNENVLGMWAGILSAKCWGDLFVLLSALQI